MCLAPGLLYIYWRELATLVSSLLNVPWLDMYIEELTINDHLIDWTFNGQPLTTDSNYIISVASRECPPYGTCGLGFLRIVDVASDDHDIYVCSFGDLSQTIYTDIPATLYVYLQSYLTSTIHALCDYIAAYFTSSYMWNITKNAAFLYNCRGRLSFLQTCSLYMKGWEP